MKLDDFLKPRKVRCINSDNRKDLTDGKLYDVAGAACGRLRIHNDNGDELWYGMNCFELVIESAENPLQDMELTPETEASEPKFEVGNKVYKYGETDVKTVLEVFENGYMRISNYPYRVNHETLCHATPKNHAVLSKPFPAIEFEQPPKPLSGDGLVTAMLAKGIKNVLCLWANGDKIVIDGLDYKGALVNINNNIVSGLTPIDWCTGEPLTEAMLDE